MTKKVRAKGTKPKKVDTKEVEKTIEEKRQQYTELIEQANKINSEINTLELKLLRGDTLKQGTLLWDVERGDNHIRKLLSSFVWSDSIVFWYNGKLISNERLPCLLTTGRTRESIIRELEQEENQLTEDFKRYEIEKLHNLEEVVKSKKGPRV